MIRFCSLGSGSSGNSFYVGNGAGAVLLDAGFSGKETMARLREAGLDPGSIRAVMISHEHTDHVKGAGVVARMLDVPVCLSEKTYERAKKAMGRVPGIVHFSVGERFDAEGMDVASFSIPHDAADPCAFVFHSSGTRMAVVTDAGSATMLIEERLRGVDYIVVEANHDPDMLKAGPYPWELKQRIASRVGHMSNEACAGLVRKVAHSGLQGVTFAHLSRTNNNPDLVRLMAEEALGEAGTPYSVASQDRPGPIVNVE